jgi:hypothetical protein
MHGYNTNISPFNIVEASRTTTNIKYNTSPSAINGKEDEESICANSWELRNTDRMSAGDIDSLLGEVRVKLINQKLTLLQNLVL